MTKRTEFVNAVKQEVENNSIYVWGGQGELVEQATLSKIESMEGQNATNINRVLKHISDIYLKGVKRARMFDCSGLVTYHLIKLGVLMYDMTANGLFNHCNAIAKKELLPGDLVFTVKNGKASHVAVFVGGENNDELVEAVGRDVGVAITKLSTKFNKYGRLPKL